MSRHVRIIGGHWRGRRLSFPDSETLRPSGDRVRETLFNWLQPTIRGAHCLDLFAGSGVLGIEAVSRGAESSILVDVDTAALRHLHEQVVSLQASARIQVVRSDAERYLDACSRQFDLVFLDPPFGAGLLANICHRLVERALLRPGGRVYLETGATEPELVLPAGWTWYRQNRMGQVRFGLAHPTDDPPPASRWIAAKRELEWTSRQFTQGLSTRSRTDTST